MADVFISYSHADREIAEGLAKFLDSLGYEVWWDYELVGGSNFRDQILEQLRAAKAVVVIWSQYSVDASRSKWPREEAAEAERLKTLVPVRVPELSIADVPLGYRDYQTDYVTEPDRLLKAFGKMGVVPSKAQAAPAAPVAIAGKTIDPGIVDEAQQFARWKSIEKSTNAQDFRDFLKGDADSPLAELARVRLSGFEDKAYAELQRDMTAQRIQRFLKDFPTSRHVNELTRRLYGIESAVWAEVAKSRDPERIAKFLIDHPDGHRASEAREMLRELRLSVVEAAAWKKLGPSPTAEQLEGFIKEFPLGAYVDEARTLLRQARKAERRARKWAEIKDQPYNEPVRSFITEFEDGPEVDAARTLLVERRKAREDGDWAKVRLERHAAPILAFLREHPGGAHEKAAIALLKDLPRLNEAEAWSVVRDAGNEQLQQLFATLFPGSSLLPPASNVSPTGQPRQKSHQEQAPTASPASALHSLSAETSTAWRPDRWFYAAMFLALVSVAIVSNALPTRSGQPFGLGLALGMVPICLFCLVSSIRSLVGDRSAWHIQGIVIGHQVLAAAWALGLFLVANRNDERIGSAIWLACGLAILGLHALQSRCPPASSPRLGRKLTSWVQFAALGAIAVCCLAILLMAAMSSPIAQWLNRLLLGFAFNTSCTYGCTSPLSFLIQSSLTAGFLTGAIGCLSLLQALRHRGIWGRNEPPLGRADP